MTEAYGQVVEVGPVKVDTGSPWIDVAGAGLLIALVIILMAKFKSR